MKGVQDLRRMCDVILAFWDNFGFNSCSLVVQAGNLFANDNGRNRTAEFFLRGFLVEYLNGRECAYSIVQTCLERAVADLDGKEATHRVNEILENCFAFLIVFKARTQLNTKWALEAVAANPPHPDFLSNVRRKIVASNMEGGTPAIAA